MERISWTEYFSQLACLVSKRSPCERLHVGCVLVRENRVISTGYNGFLPGAVHESIVLDGHEQATIHAEQNAVADCARRGAAVDGASAYITHFPCINCFKMLAAAGVKEIFYLDDYKNSEIVGKLAADSGIALVKL